MGNSIGKFGVCFTGGNAEAHHHQHDLYVSAPYDEGLGHSFCYVRPDPTRIPASGPSKIHSEESATSSSIFRTISGASVSANTSTTPLSAQPDPDLTAAASGPLFESSTSFAAVALQPIPRSGPLLEDRGFMSGPIERGFLSGPLDRYGPVFSGPLDRSFSHSNHGRFKPRKRSGSLIRGLRRVISKFGQSSVVAPVKVGQPDNNWVVLENKNKNEFLSSEPSLEGMNSWESQSLQWAQGKAGEDRVHVVVSEEHGWVFVGIYDGFNGPDATDFLVSNLYSSVQKELKGLLWDDISQSDSPSSCSVASSMAENTVTSCGNNSGMEGSGGSCCLQDNSASGVGESNRKRGRNSKTKYKGAAKKWQENQRRWKYEWDRERLELDCRLKEQSDRTDTDLGSGGDSGGGFKAINHGEVLKAMSRALKKTEETYFEIADKMLDENPELALMGSCVLAMLMKGEDVYVMNVGDSRALLAQNKDPDLGLGKIDQDLERINEESLYDCQVSDGVKPSLRAFQLTMDHSTCVEEEVVRIKGEHPDDAVAVVNDRVKGSLKVTRAFGAGFLKQPKWNNALLEMFRIEYVGTSPYISCQPSLYHHRLGPKDQFLILSSDGLYQYFTNEEAVAEVELFITLSPEGDPAQHLVEEVLFRAAKKAGMDFLELLEIPQGDRRKYHDDVSIIVISFEGRIWRSCV